MTYWQRKIRAELAELGKNPDDFNAVHIEGWMRLEHGTLNGLEPDVFREEVVIGADMSLEDPEGSEKLAQSII